MRSFALFFFALFIGAAISVTLEVEYLRDITVGSLFAPSALSVFAFGINNDQTVPITNVQYFVMPLNFIGVYDVAANSFLFPGNLHTINPTATGSQSFTIPTSYIDNPNSTFNHQPPTILVTSFWWQRGIIQSVSQTFTLSRSSHFKRESVETEQVGAKRDETFSARSTYYLVAPTTFQAVVGTATWNALNFRSTYGNLNSFSYTAACNDPGNTVTIGYQASGTNLGTVGTTGYKTSSIQLYGGYPPGGDGDYWNITVYTQFKIGTNTTYTNAQTVQKFYITSGDKRSAEKDEAFDVVAATLSTHTSGLAMRAEYAILVAVAGVVVAAVAIIAAVVIVRRRPQAISTL